jgi:hypothetical protein
MEQNGANNGQDAKPPASSAASGANKSPKKRRKVNHGMRTETQKEIQRARRNQQVHFLNYMI